MTNPVPARLSRLREHLRNQGVDACLVPSADPHLSEYLPARWQGREWLSGFTGSAGTLVVTTDWAGLWTDSRYWVQAEHELQGSGIELGRIQSSSAPNHVQWLAEHLPDGGTLAADGAVLSLSAAKALRDAFGPRGLRLRTDFDPLAAVWDDRPGLPDAPIYEHRPPQATRPREERLGQLRKAMNDLGAQWHVISSLDDIAWLLNLRGSDVPYNPVFVAHLLVTTERASLFVADGKLPSEVRATLMLEGIRVEPYDKIRSALAGLSSADRVLVDPARITLGLLDALPEGIATVEAINPSHLLKSRKNRDEIRHVRATMEEDGAALCEFFAWFETALGNEPISELTIDERLSAARARRPDFVSLSFPTIAGFNANGALPHYRATEAAHSMIEGDGLLLIDSGGQYLGGTTDITRVVPVGAPSAAQKQDYTRVLKGMIGLSRARFPKGLPSPMLDALARAPLWEAGLDYGHGTGHGVGYFLNVHEGPQVISYHAQPAPKTALLPGMITSNEPGLYRPGKWGIRIENLLLCREAGDQGFGEFLEFETLTLCPIDTRCIDTALLREDEIDWLNAYHREVWERLSPRVEGATREWLEARTQPLGR